MRAAGLAQPVLSAHQVEVREERAHGIAHLVGDARGEAPDRGEAFGPLEAIARRPQTLIALAEIRHGLLQSVRPRLERLGHLVEGTRDVGGLGHALFGHAGFEAALLEGAGAVGEPLQRTHHPTTQHRRSERGEDRHRTERQRREQGRWCRRRHPHHRDAAALGHRESHWLPGSPRGKQRRARATRGCGDLP